MDRMMLLNVAFLIQSMDVKWYCHDQANISRNASKTLK